VGEHARVVEPDDVAGLAAALREAIDEPEPPRRERLARAREHAATFSWKALAERWHAVYDEVAEART
jgi:glycosyltransferase involved in cell wall biosynthesis